MSDNLSKNISTTSNKDLENFLQEFDISFKSQVVMKEKKESFNDLIDKVSLSQVVTTEASKKRRTVPFFLSLLLLHVITFACLYYLYLRIESFDTIKPPENLNPPYSEEEIIIPLKPADLYKKTAFTV